MNQICFFDVFPRRRPTLYAQLIDILFYTCLLLYPFSHVAIDRETGEGAFLKYMYILFFVLATPLWKRYFRKIGAAFILFISVVLLGHFVDCCYMGWSALSVLLIPMRQNLIGIFLGIVAYNLICKDHRHIKWITATIVIGAISTAVSLYGGVGVVEHTEQGVAGVRMSVAGQNSNATGQIMVSYLVFLIMVVANAIPISRVNKVLLFVFSIIVFVTLIRVASRGSILTLMFSLPIIFMTTRSITKKMAYILLSIIGLFVLVVAILSSDMLRGRIENTIYGRDTGGREAIFHISIQLWKQAPWFGQGRTRHGYLIAEFDQRRIEVRATHNTYTNALLGSGIIGFAMYLTAFFLVFRTAFRNRRLPYGNYAFVQIACLMFMGLFGNIEHQSKTYIACALAFGVDYWAKQAYKVGILSRTRTGFVAR